MIGNSKSLLSLRFRHPNLVTLIGWGKHYELPSLSQRVVTIWVKPSNIAICCNRTEASLFGLWANDWGRHLWSFAEKSKASEPSSLPLARWPKRIEGYRIYQNIKYQRTSMKIWRWTPCSPCFWTMWQNVSRFPTSSSFFFLPKTAKNLEVWKIECLVGCSIWPFPICTIPSQRRFIGWKPQILLDWKPPVGCGCYTNLDGQVGWSIPGY